MLNRRSQAFTLIEIMIVIAIIGILAGIMVPNFMRARGEAKLSACEQNLLTIAKAVEMAKIRHPEVIAANTYGTYDIDPQCPLVTEGYLKSAPKCPGNGNYYFIHFVGGVSGGGMLPIAEASRYAILHTLPGHRDLSIPMTYPEYHEGYGIVRDPNEYHDAW